MDIHLKDVDDDLGTRIKMRAIAERKTFKELICELLSNYVKATGFDNPALLNGVQNRETIQPR